MSYELYDQPIYTDVPGLPAGAVLQVIGIRKYKGKTRFRVGKPDDNGLLYLANSPYNWPANRKTGSACLLTRNAGAWVKFEGTLNVGKECGPKANSWAMSHEGKGFVALGDPAGGMVRVATIGGPGGGTNLVRFELLADKLKDNNEGFACLLDDNWQRLLDDQGQPINVYVLDTNPKQHFGYGPIDEPHYGQLPGSKGFCQFVTAEHVASASVGGGGQTLPAYAIVTMDTVLRFMILELVEDWTDGKGYAKPPEGADAWGWPIHNRKPKTIAFETGQTGGGGGGGGF